MSPRVSDALLRVQSDDRLAMLARSGHERAFVAIVERYRRPLHAFARRLVPEPRVDDVLQQSFVNAWAALSAGSEVRHLRGWLHQIVRNAAIAAARAPGEDQLSETMIGEEGPQAEVERRLQLQETLRHVARLPEQQRLALVQTAMEGRSREEIASGLGLSEGAVRGLVHRARSTLRAAATAITPLPLAVWAAQGGGGAPVAEVAAGAGAGSMAGLAVKAGTVVVATGAIATSVATDLPQRIRHHHAHRAVAVVRDVERPPAATPVVAAAPAPVRHPAAPPARVSPPAPVAPAPAAPVARHDVSEHHRSPTTTETDTERSAPASDGASGDGGAQEQPATTMTTTTAEAATDGGDSSDGGNDGGGSSGGDGSGADGGG